MGQNIRALDVISVFFSMAAFLAGFAYRKRLPAYCIPVLVLVALAFLVDFSCLVMAYFGIFVNEIVYIYTVVEFILLSLFYKQFFKSARFSIILYFLVAALFITGIFDFYKHSLNNVKNYMNTIEAVCLIAFSFSLFLYVMKNHVTDHLAAETFFWINCAVLLYFAGNLVFFLLIKILSLKQIALMWEFLHNSLSILYNILLILGFWKTRTLRT